MIYGRRVIGTIGYMGGVPALLEEFTYAWGQLIEFNYEYLCEPGQRIRYIRSKQSFHSIARNKMANDALGDWLLMLDTDHIFEPDICLRMLKLMEHFKLDILSAIYFHKDPPHVPVMFKHGEDGKSMLNLGSWPKDVELLNVDSTGAGTLMVKRDVFKRVRRELREEPFDIIPPYGEDHSFFLRCEKIGIKAWCTPLIESGHLKVVPVTSDDYYPVELGSVEGVFTTAGTIGYQNV